MYKKFIVFLHFLIRNQNKYLAIVNRGDLKSKNRSQLKINIYVKGEIIREKNLKEKPLLKNAFEFP